MSFALSQREHSESPTRRRGFVRRFLRLPGSHIRSFCRRRFCATCYLCSRHCASSARSDDLYGDPAAAVTGLSDGHG